MALNVFELFAKLGLDTSEYESGLSNAESLGSRFGSGLQSAARVGVAALAGATTAAVGFAGSSVRAGADFDSAMSQVAATMNTTVDQIQNLRDYAQEMGSTTAFSATESAEALNYMALAGYDAETSMSMLPTVLNLAASGGIDLARASDMVTDASSALGLSIEQTSVMVDQMAMAAASSNTSVEQLGDAFLTLGATGANAAGGTNELATLFGVLADNGIKGAEGGTHLRNMILSLTNPTNTAGDALEQLGIQMYDSEGNMRNMVDIIYEFQQATEDMTMEERDSVIGQIFNRADMASVNALLNTSIERYDELSESLDNAAGSAEQMAETQLDNLSGDVTIFQSALEGAQIALSDALTPTLREFVQMGTEGLSSVTQGFQEGGLEGAMQALGTWLSGALTKIVEMTPTIVRAGMELLSALGRALVDNAPMIADSALEVLQMLVDSFTEAVNGDGATNFMETTMEIITKIGEFLITNAPALITAAVNLITQLALFMTDPANLGALIDMTLDLIIAIADGLVQSAPALGNAVVAIIGNLLMTIMQEIPQILLTIGDLLGDIFLFVANLIGGFLGGTEMDFFTAVDNIMNGSIEDFRQGFLLFVDDVIGFAQDMWTHILDFFTGGIFGVGNALGGWWDEITSFFADLASNALTWASDLIDNFVSGITGGITRVGDAVSGIADEVRAYLGFSEPEQGSLSNFHTFAPDMVDLWNETLEDSIPTLDTGLQSMSDYIAEGMPSLDGAGDYAGIATMPPIVVQAYFGNEKFDEYVVNSNQRIDYISGGRA